MHIDQHKRLIAGIAATGLTVLAGSGIAMAAGNGATPTPVTTVASAPAVADITPANAPAGEVADQESAGEVASDGPDQGPDSNPAEPGHQDAAGSN